VTQHLETYESREDRVRHSAPKLVMDVLETRQPVRLGDVFTIVREKSPLLTISDVQEVVMELLCKGHIYFDSHLRLVITD
jgi:hypothetical protein